MFSSGFFVVPRELVLSDVWRNLEPTHRTVFMTILAKANWKDGQWFDGIRNHTIKRGQFVTSRRKLGDLCGRGISEQIARTALKRLKSAQLINHHSTKHWTLVTVLNYENYGLDPYLGNQQDNQPNNQPITNGEPSDNQPITTIESIKEGKALKHEDKDTYVGEFQEHWNSHASLPRISSMSPSRVKKLQARRSDPKFKEKWKEAIDRMAKSKFCTGGGDRGWKANVDWFLRNDRNWVRILEGEFDDGKPRQSKYGGMYEDD